MTYLWQIFKKGIIEQNPIFVLALSLCPALAVTTSVLNALTMGLSVLFVITMNNISVSIIRNFVNPKVRVPIYITSIATIVTVVILLLQAYAPLLYKALGIYLSLVVVFAIILARAEVFAAKNQMIPAMLDGLGMGAGFTLAMVVIGAIRELIGTGTLLAGTKWAVNVFGDSYQPALIMILPPGAFILIGYLVGISKVYNERMERRRAELKAKEAKAA